MEPLAHTECGLAVLRPLGKDGAMVASSLTGEVGGISADDLSVVSVCLDGTRMSGQDTLYVCVYLPDVGLAAWCPPQVFVRGN